MPEPVRPECWELLQGLFPSRTSLSKPAGVTHCPEPASHKVLDVLQGPTVPLGSPIVSYKETIIVARHAAAFGACTLCAPFCGWGEALLPLAGSVLCRSLSLQLGERPHSSWHWREWQQLTWDRMWPWVPVWPHPPTVVMWQCALIYSAFILLLSCHWSWTSMPSKYLHFSRTSPDQGCAATSWDGTREQGLFRILSQSE